MHAGDECPSNRLIGKFPSCSRIALLNPPPTSSLAKENAFAHSFSVRRHAISDARS
jgi:hypothetical protein